MKFIHTADWQIGMKAGADGGPRGTQDNTIPQVTAASEPLSGEPPLEVSFTGSGNDEWGIAAYAWDFDSTDGIQADSTEQNPTHTYGHPGKYIATLTATDNSGLSGIAKIEISVGTPPTASACANPVYGPGDLTDNFSGEGSGDINGHTIVS